MNEELFEALKKALFNLQKKVEEYRKDLSMSGIEPDYWLDYEFEIEAAVEEVKTARSELESAFEAE